MAGGYDHWWCTGFYYRIISGMSRIHLLFCFSFGIFLLNLLVVRLPIQLPTFFSSYLNDLLCMPVVLCICLYIIRKVSQNKRLKISLFSALSLAALYSIYFEFYLPLVTTRYTSDIVDTLLYFSGSFIFWLVQKTEFPQDIRHKK